MKPNAATRLVGLAWLMLVAPAASPAWAKSAGRVLKNPDATCSSSKDDNCPRTTNDDLTVLKCERCQRSMPSLMKTVAKTDVSDKQQRKCYDIIDNPAKSYASYLSNAEFVRNCTNSRNLLYDGAVGCGCNAGIISHCSLRSDMNDCLCGKKFTRSLFGCMQDCFQRGDASKATPSCAAAAFAQGLNPQPKRSRRPAGAQPRKPWTRKASGAGHAALSNAQQSENDDNGDEDDDAQDEVLDEDDGDIDKKGWPPEVEEQFSPVLTVRVSFFLSSPASLPALFTILYRPASELTRCQDRDVSFYIDINERAVYVDSDTFEVIRYEPYWLYPVPFYDEILDSTKEDKKWLRRNYFYPLSNRVWYYQWLVGPDVYNKYATQTLDTNVGLASSTGYIASTSFPAAQTTETPASPDPSTTPDATTESDPHGSSAVASAAETSASTISTTAADATADSISQVASAAASATESSARIIPTTALDSAAGSTSSDLSAESTSSSSTAGSAVVGTSSAAVSRLLPFSSLVVVQFLTILYHGF